MCNLVHFGHLTYHILLAPRWMNLCQNTLEFEWTNGLCQQNICEVFPLFSELIADYFAQVKLDAFLFCISMTFSLLS